MQRLKTFIAWFYTRRIINHLELGCSYREAIRLASKPLPRLFAAVACQVNNQVNQELHRQAQRAFEGVHKHD